MDDYELPIARETLDALLSAKPEADDKHLVKAAELSSPEKNTTVRPRDDLRGEVHLAVQRLRKVISEGASAVEGERLLKQAIDAARSVASGQILAEVRSDNLDRVLSR
jgi:hypothetical protein